MTRKKRGKDDNQRGDLADETQDSLDAVDQINQDLGFLRETLKLIEAASSGREEWRGITLVHVTEEMLIRVERVRELCRRFLDHESKEIGKV
ncbi:MAG: hypothetical protein ABSA46_18060 [Thermodesulfovibrionales bacterium]